jgi:hypothetical protein
LKNIGELWGNIEGCGFATFAKVVKIPAKIVTGTRPLRNGQLRE